MQIADREGIYKIIQEETNKVKTNTKSTYEVKLP